MQRHFFISDDLDDLEVVESDLIKNGVTEPQMHVLSDNDSEVAKHKLHQVEAVLRKDVVHSMQRGAVIGVLGCVAVLALAYFTGLTDTAAGWVPFIFLSIVILGFCTWEGGLIGIESPHYQLKQFEKALKNGKHLFYVDIDPEQEQLLKQVMQAHSHLKPAGVGQAAPRWVVRGQDKARAVLDSLP